MSQMMSQSALASPRLRVDPRLVIGLLAVLLGCCALLHLGPAKLYLLLHGRLPMLDQLLICRFRLPRLVMAVMVGSGLAVAGWAAQQATRNPLASPDVLAVPAAATLGVTIMFWLANGHLLGAHTLPLVAAGSGALAGILLFAIVGRIGGLDGSRFLLVGVSMGAIFSAGSFVIDLFLPLSAEGQRFGPAFMAGQLMRANWDFVWLLLPAWWLLMLAIIASSGRLSVLRFEDDIVTQLGGSRRWWRGVSLCLSAALCASCVGVAGGFGFIGFVAPQIVRAMSRHRSGGSPWAVALVGAMLLLFADVIGQFVVWPDQIPAGAVVAIIGAPFFLIFMFTRRLIGEG